jgi:HAD superfamily hydrolase (TIGR01509 family)
MRVQNIIFDLGGVILNLDFHRTAEAFTKLGVVDFHSFFTQYHAHPLFQSLEKGKVPEPKFYDELREVTQIKATDTEIDAAWNAMLLDFKQPVLAEMERLSRQGYRLFLFSNTNAIHHAFFLKQYEEQYGKNFDDLFEAAWYSHLIGARKPDQQAFLQVLELANLKAEETLFIDDTLPNIEAAAAIGMQTALATASHTVVEILSERSL